MLLKIPFFMFKSALDLNKSKQKECSLRYKNTSRNTFQTSRIKQRNVLQQLGPTVYRFILFSCSWAIVGVVSNEWTL